MLKFPILFALTLFIFALTGCEASADGSVPLWAQIISLVPFAGILGFAGVKGGQLLANLVKDAYWSGVVKRAVTAVSTAVGSVQQEYVDAIKAGKADGKLTEEEVAEAKNRALVKVKSYLGSKGLRELAKVFALPADVWLSDQIDAEVQDRKLATKAVPVVVDPS